VEISKQLAVSEPDFGPILAETAGQIITTEPSMSRNQMAGKAP
jgi:hypothetical protein